MTAAAKQSKGKQKMKIPEQVPSANWLALQKKIKNASNPPSKKRRKTESIADDGASEAGSSTLDNTSVAGFARSRESHSSHPSVSASVHTRPVKHGRESLDYLRRMVLGKVEYSEEQKQPGKYLALDCEMVGVGPEGVESSLARVSLVNYHGAVILDEFVRQRERVVDYRTFVSGVRADDMAKAIPFADVQKRVADLLKDRILVGHAVQNDLKALLLSQPRSLIRDTQLCAGKARLLKSKYPALRKLAQQELGITIQAGEHSSVTDARATMALYRLHRNEWDKGFRSVPNISASTKALGKRKASTEDDEADEEESQDTSSLISALKAPRKHKGAKAITGGGRRGISSGLSTVVKHASERNKFGKLAPEASRGGKGKKNWWSTLDGVPSLSQVKTGSEGTVSTNTSR